MDISKFKIDMDLIYNKLIEVNEKIYVYKYLFADNDNIDLLNEFNYGIFTIFQETLWNDLLSSIFRITDNAQFKEDNNISIKFIRHKYVLEEYINDIVDDDINLIRKKIEKYRHKILMHNDYNETKNGNLFNLIQIEDLEKLILLLDKILIDIYKKYFDIEIEFIPINVNPDLFINHLLKFKA